MNGTRCRNALLAWLVVLAVFLALGFSVGVDRLNEIELPSARAFNSMVGRSEAFDRTIIFFNHKFGEGACVLAIFAAYVLFARANGVRSWRAIAAFGLAIFLVWAACNAVSDVLEKMIERDSPGVLLRASGEHRDLAKLYDDSIKTISKHSFPSNHGTVFFTVFFMCWFGFGRRALWLLPLVVVLTTPRVFGGAHWLSDGLVGSPLIVWPVAAVASFGIAKWRTRDRTSDSNSSRGWRERESARGA